MCRTTLSICRHPSKSKEEGKGAGHTDDGSRQPLSSDPSYLLSLSKKASDEAVQYILKQLQEQGLVCEASEDGSERYVRVSAGLEVLAWQVFSVAAKINDGIIENGDCIVGREGTMDDVAQRFRRGTII